MNTSPMNTAPYMFIVDTNQYAGNFERQMVAYMTGLVGDCRVGTKEAEICDFEMRAFGLESLQQLVEFCPDETGCYRPVVIVPTPMRWNDGYGKCYDGDPTGKWPAYESVGLLLSRLPTDEQIHVLERRAHEFADYHNSNHPVLMEIRGFRLFKRECHEEQLPLPGKNQDVNTSNVKQVIVVRKDLNMRKGKIAAQVAHASMAVLLNQGNMCQYLNSTEFQFTVTPAVRQWIEGSFTKVCVYVNSEAELLAVVEQAKNAGVLHALITDSGLTEFHGVATNTCVAIGPDYVERINPITGHLPLL